VNPRGIVADAFVWSIKERKKKEKVAGQKILGGEERPKKRR